MPESNLSPKKLNNDDYGNSFESALCAGDLTENKKKFAERNSTFVKSFKGCQKSRGVKKRVYVDKD